MAVTVYGYAERTKIYEASTGATVHRFKIPAAAQGDASAGLVNFYFRMSPTTQPQWQSEWVYITDIHFATEDTTAGNINIRFTAADWDELNQPNTAYTLQDYRACGSAPVSAGYCTPMSERMPLIKKPLFLGRWRNYGSIYLWWDSNVDTKYSNAVAIGYSFNRFPNLILK